MRSHKTLPEIKPPTLEQRQELHNRRADAALSIFGHAAIELETAADELDKVAAEAHAIVVRHKAIQEEADGAAAAHRANATKIKNLFN